MNGRIIKTETDEDIEETKKRIKELREKNKKLSSLFL